VAVALGLAVTAFVNGWTDRLEENEAGDVAR
jgi:hypothetical protein